MQHAPYPESFHRFKRHYQFIQDMVRADTPILFHNEHRPGLSYEQQAGEQSLATVLALNYVTQLVSCMGEAQACAGYDPQLRLKRWVTRAQRNPGCTNI